MEVIIYVACYKVNFSIYLFYRFRDFSNKSMYIIEYTDILCSNKPILNLDKRNSIMHKIADFRWMA